MVHAARLSAPHISEPLTWSEICERYPEQHVYLVELQLSASSQHIEVARVIGHGALHDALAQAMRHRDHYKVIAHRFTGRHTGCLARPAMVLDDEIRELIRPQW